MSTNSKSLPGWSMTIEETSNGVFRITLTDEYGRIAELRDDATNETISKAIGYAFDIEMQVCKNWSLFLYNLCLLRFDSLKFINQCYDDAAFGSWYISLQGKRVLYDGKDGWLIYQTRNCNSWEDRRIIKREELSYKNLLGLLKDLNPGIVF